MAEMKPAVVYNPGPQSRIDLFAKWMADGYQP